MRAFALSLICYLFMAGVAVAQPRIGVSGQSATSPSVIALMAVLRYAGADPVFIGDHVHQRANTDLATLDALVVAGNNYDIDPAVYGQTPDPHTNNELQHGPEATARATYEFSAIEQALTMRMPLLGICGGMQRMNVGGDVSQQGTLHQHVPGNNQWPRGIPPFQASGTLTIEPDTLLSGMAHRAGGSLHWQENSLHHQAADRIREGFRISARNNNGVIKAIEPDPKGPYAGQFALGVQWHPEYGASALQRGIISSFVEAAARYRTHK